jgi:hypothetical protein
MPANGWFPLFAPFRKGPARPEPVQFIEPLVDVGHNGLKKNTLFNLTYSHAIAFKAKLFRETNRLASPVPK